MGMGHNIECKSCGYSENLLFQGGFYSKATVLFNEKTGEIRSILEDYGEGVTSYFEEERLGKLRGLLTEDWKGYLNEKKIQKILDFVKSLSEDENKKQVRKLLSEDWLEVEDFEALEKIANRIKCPECGNVGFKVTFMDILWD